MSYKVVEIKETDNFDICALYEKVFRKALKKYNVDSPKELDKEKKKKFFNYVDSIYTAKGESTRLGAAAQGVKKYQKEASDDDSEDG